MKPIIIITIVLFFSCNSAEIETSSQEVIKTQSVTKSLQNGDLIFQTSLSSQSQAIQITTNSKYSHVGIIYELEGEYYVYEAVQPVKITKLKTWINRGKNGEYVVKRLKNSSEFLTESGIEKLKSVGKQYLGKDYDLRFEWSDDKIYCSELVWKMYKEAFDIEIGKLEKMEDFDLSNEIVRKKVKERYGNEVPKDELVITPDRLFQADI